MACPGEDDLSGVALDPPNVLENVDATMGLAGAGTAFVRLLRSRGWRVLRWWHERRPHADLATTPADSSGTFTVAQRAPRAVRP